MIINMVKAAAKVLKMVRTTVDVAKDCVVLNSNICITCWFVLLSLVLVKRPPTAAWGKRMESTAGILERQDQIEEKLTMEV